MKKIRVNRLELQFKQCTFCIGRGPFCGLRAYSTSDFDEWGLPRQAGGMARGLPPARRPLFPLGRAQTDPRTRSEIFLQRSDQRKLGTGYVRNIGTLMKNQRTRA